MKDLIPTFENKWGLLTYLCLLLFMALFFQEAWLYPSIDAFPAVERILNPKFLMNDFYTNTFESFSPRLIHAYTIAYGSKLFGLPYTEFIAYINILRIICYGWGLYLLFLYLSNKKIALVALTLSALSFLSMPFLPAWWPVTFDYTASNVALTFSIFAWALTVKNKIAFSLLLLACAVFIHPLVGLHSFLISLLLFITIYKWQGLLPLFRQPLVYVTGLLYAIAFLFNYLSMDQVISDERFIFINGVYRHGHHFLLGHMDIEKWISTIIFIVFALTIYVWQKNKYTYAPVILSVSLYSISMILIGYVFTEVIPSRFVFSFIPMRSFSILVPIILLAIAHFIVWKWERKDYVTFYALFLPFLPYAGVGLTWYLLPGAHFLLLGLIILAFVFSIAMLSLFFPQIFSLPNKMFNKIMGHASISVYLLPIAVAALGVSILQFKIRIPTLSNSADIYTWVNKNTPSNSIILSELNAANNQKLRLVARRAVIVGKDFPFNEHFYEEWFQRYSSLYKHRDEASGQIDQLSAKALNTLMDHYHADILLRTKELSFNRFFKEMGRSQGEKEMTIIYRNINFEDAS